MVPNGATARLCVISFILSVVSLVIVCHLTAPVQAGLYASTASSPPREPPSKPKLTIKDVLEQDDRDQDDTDDDGDQGDGKTAGETDVEATSGRTELKATDRPARPESRAQLRNNEYRLFRFGGWSSSRGGPSKADTKKRRRRLSPVILVPGYGGSRLEAKINKQHVEHYFCEKHTDWTNIWIDLKLMLPYMIDCLIEDFRLVFDEATNTTHNTQGVDIRVKNPDELATVEYLTDLHLSSFGYFAAIIRRLTQALGYERDVNLRGAPYDFRKAPNEMGEYFIRMRSQCEELLELSGQPVTFICHSMGCNNVLYFLQRQSQHWKDRHIRRVVSLAAPFGGSMQAARATVFGDNLGLPYLFDEAELKIVQQSVPSTMYLFPSPLAFGDAPLVRTNVPPPSADSNGVEAPHQSDKPQETITARDFKDFFDRINHPSGYLMWLNTKDLLNDLSAPGVEVHCLYGQGHSTLFSMDFDGEFPNSNESDHFEDGDGTVAVQSSTYCKNWATEQAQPVKLRPFYANHVEMVKDPDIVNAVEEILKPEQS